MKQQGPAHGRKQQGRREQSARRIKLSVRRSHKSRRRSEDRAGRQLDHGAENNQAGGAREGPPVDRKRSQHRREREKGAAPPRPSSRAEQTIAKARTRLASQPELSLQATLASNEVKTAPPKAADRGERRKHSQERPDDGRKSASDARPRRSCTPPPKASSRRSRARSAKASPAPAREASSEGRRLASRRESAELRQRHRRRRQPADAGGGSSERAAAERRHQRVGAAGHGRREQRRRADAGAERE